MQLAYVAGPYRGTSKIKLINKLQVIHNILAARKVAKELWKLGYAVICPHLNGALMDGIVPDQAFLDGDLLMLDRCDLLVLQGKWHKSSGTIGEVKRAQTLEMPVFEWHGKLVQVDTLSDTVNEINFCPMCGGSRPDVAGRGHKSDCELAALLEESEGEEG